jgi:hypothetical protein
MCGEKAKLSAQQAAEPLSLTEFSHRLPTRSTLAVEKVMLNQNIFSTIIVTWVAVPSLAMFLSAVPARAQNNPSNYTFMVASGFLCDPGDSATCPAVVKSANGDFYQMSGAGTFNTQSKSVTATGTYTYESSSGTVLETGVWIASELMRFDSYGIAPGALLNGRRAFGSSQLGPKGLPMSSGPMPTGGLAVFRIRLLPMSGTSKTAVLQANCALGKVPAEREIEGIRLSFERNGTEFAQEAGGRVMFFMMRPEVSALVKTPLQEAAPDSAEPQN